MYHKNNSHVIESNDIQSLRAAHVEKLADGTIIARLTVVLEPHKAYIESPALHLTDGVQPRMLHPTPAQKETAEEPADTSEQDKGEAKEKKGKK